MDLTISPISNNPKNMKDFGIRKHSIDYPNNDSITFYIECSTSWLSCCNYLTSVCNSCRCYCSVANDFWKAKRCTSTEAAWLIKHPCILNVPHRYFFTEIDVASTLSTVPITLIALFCANAGTAMSAMTAPMSMDLACMGRASLEVLGAPHWYGPE